MINEEQELKSLFKARKKSKDKQFIMDTFMYETALIEIQEQGINNNRQTREEAELRTSKLRAEDLI